MTRKARQIGDMFATFLAVSDYDNARAALNEFRAAKGEQRYGNDNNRIYGNGWAGDRIAGAVRGELGR